MTIRSAVRRSFVLASAVALSLAACSPTQDAPVAPQESAVSGNWWLPLPPPTLSSISPSTGPAAGGSIVTIFGTSLENASRITFGDVEGLVVQRLPTWMTAVSPAGEPGSQVPVRVSVGEQLSNAVPFTYSGPQILGITPSRLSTAGGTSVTITGDNFGPNAVLVINNSAFPTTSATFTQLVFSSPPGQGSLNLKVVTASGAESQMISLPFFAPTITSVAPSTGPAAGGTMVTISGVNFGLTPSVRFGNAAAQVVTSSHTQIVATSPAGTAGTSVPVQVTAAFQSSNNATFSYAAAAPVLASITPNQGASSGGQTLTIQGTGFGTSPVLRFGNVIVPSSGSNTSIAAQTPAGIPGSTVSVTVTGPGGVSNALSYTYLPPTVSAVTPATGPTSGGNTITISGFSFGAATGSVMIGGRAATVTSWTHSSISAIVPAGEGNAPVVVSAAGVNSTPVNYRYTPPVIAAITPASGVATGGATITLTGTNFGLTPTVRFGGTIASTVSSSHTMVVVTAPAGVAGSSVPVTLSAGGQLSNAVLFSYTCPAGTVLTNGVCVITLEAATADLQGLVAALPSGVSGGLGETLSSAAAILFDGNPSNDNAACGKLGAFENQVRAQLKSRRLTATQAAALLESAATVKSVAGC